jgi:two-component system NtrC family sensor kinase
VLVARDVTDRAALERRLMHDEQMSVVGKLAAAVAHEINNPIGVVVLYSQHALAALPPDNPVYPHLEIIRRNADGCRSIVEGLLKLARPHRPERRPVDLRQLCRETMDSVRPLALRAGVRISGGGHHNGVPIWTQADAAMLRQAVLNLAVNAIEAAGEGDEVSIAAYDTQDRDVAAQAIEVRDTGAGITPGDLDQLFQPFFTTKPAGTGLGLSVAENIVRSHEGRIEVESTVGTGTTFRIVLPDRSRWA